MQFAVSVVGVEEGVVGAVELLQFPVHGAEQATLLEHVDGHVPASCNFKLEF